MSKNINVTKLRNTRIGKVTENVIEVSKKKGKLTITDVLNLRNKLIGDGKAKHDHVEIQMIKVLAGQWMTFKSEAKMNDYFDASVADTSKFLEFDVVQFYVMSQ